MQAITQEIWRDKYRYGEEKTIGETLDRVIDGVYAKDQNVEEREKARRLIQAGHIVPAGRILAGAGTPKRVTMINCFVSPRIQDSMDTIPGEPGKGIMDALKDAALTQQMGGGIGMDFSTVRPNGSLVKRTHSVSSGVLPFMDMWNAMCRTVKSSGSRRGAMMGTLAIWHPDVLDFVVAKRTKDRLKNFNISVLVTDDFMKAVEQDGDWDLYFTVPRADGQHVEVYDVKHERRYVYKRIRARELWDTITENTYIHAEPGVIFIDRINQFNNLWYCEHLHCTNPCGEQPLPPDGDCNLGHVHLSGMVMNPFTSKACFDFSLLAESARVMLRLLDNVLDITQFPTEGQRIEAMNKRRTGIGYTGLATALQQLRIPYGSPEAIRFARIIGRELRDAVYWASVDLAKERGSFPLFNADSYCMSQFVQTLPKALRGSIRKHGIRNGVLLTIAPTGTTSILLGNVSSGIEPVFLHEYDRKVLRADGVTFETHPVYDYGFLKWQESRSSAPVGDLPPYFVTAKDLTVRQHLEMQAAAQEFIDASISKTINCPTEMTFEEFKDVYSLAFKMGLKGCTTYRYDPRSQRGEVLSERKVDSAPAEIAKSIEKAADIPSAHTAAAMQELLEGRRYRIKWPGEDNAYYLMIMDYIDPNGVRRPFECFIQSKSVAHHAWISALTRTISAIFRREDNVSFLATELQQVHAMSGGGVFHNQKYVPSLVAMIGVKIEEHLRWLGLIKDANVVHDAIMNGTPDTTGTSFKGLVEHAAQVCDRCLAPAMIMEEGCRKCKSCGYSHCGG